VDGQACQVSGFASFAGEAEADTVVVGGGITGVTVGWLLSEMRQRVVLLEARTLGSSGTGHSTGNLYGTLSSGLAPLR
jgi:glycine/D-amino acid oxidase-like deaminating enzyme